MLYYFLKKWFSVFPWVSIHFKIVVLITCMFYVKNGNWPWWIMMGRGMYCIPMNVCVICHIFSIKIVFKQQTFLKKNCLLVAFISGWDSQGSQPLTQSRTSSLYGENDFGIAGENEWHISMITVLYCPAISLWLINPVDLVLCKDAANEVHLCEAGWWHILLQNTGKF